MLSLATNLMGTPLPKPDIDYGSNCPACTGEDMLWEPGQTPEKVYAVFSNLAACPCFDGILPNGKSFVLLQDPLVPCWWVHVGSIWRVRFIAAISGEDASELLLQWNPGSKIAFQGRWDPCPFEYHAFQNISTECTSLVCCTGGIGVVSWNSIPQDLVDFFGLVRSEGLMYEARPKSPTEIVHKFCSTNDSTNIKILKNL